MTTFTLTVNTARKLTLISLIRTVSPMSLYDARDNVNKMIEQDINKVVINDIQMAQLLRAICQEGGSILPEIIKDVSVNPIETVLDLSS